MKVKYTKELMEEAVKNSLSYAGVCRAIGLRPVGNNYKTIKSKIELYNLDISHFTGQRWNKGKGGTEETAIHSLDQILKENVIYSSDSLRKRLIKSGLKENKCEICELSGEEIHLELHHINGNHYDNRIENLQILCPNCHSKTPNYRNRNQINTTEARRIEVTRNHNAICENCGKHFYNERLDKIRRFCCRECYLEFCKKYSLGEENKNIPSIDFIKEKIKECSDLTTLGKLLGVSKTTARNYLQKFGLYEEFKSKYNFHAKPVLQYDINNNLIREWPSAIDAEQTLGIYKVSDCCHFKRKSAGGFIWRFK